MKTLITDSESVFLNTDLFRQKCILYYFLIQKNTIEDVSINVFGSTNRQNEVMNVLSLHGYGNDKSEISQNSGRYSEGYIDESTMMLYVIRYQDINEYINYLDTWENFRSYWQSNPDFKYGLPVLEYFLQQKINNEGIKLSKGFYTEMATDSEVENYFRTCNEKPAWTSIEVPLTNSNYIAATEEGLIAAETKPLEKLWEENWQTQAVYRAKQCYSMVRRISSEIYNRSYLFVALGMIIAALLWLSVSFAAAGIAAVAFLFFWYFGYKIAISRRIHAEKMDIVKSIMVIKVLSVFLITSEILIFTMEFNSYPFGDFIGTSLWQKHLFYFIFIMFICFIADRYCNKRGY